MAGKAENASVGLAEAKYLGKMYEKRWVIPNWDRVRRRPDEMTALTFDYETGNSSGVQTKWLLGFKTDWEEGPTNFFLYWKLVGAKGFRGGKVHATMSSMVLFEGSRVWALKKIQEETVDLGEIVYVPMALPLYASWDSVMNSNGEMILSFRLVIKDPEVPPEDLQMELFQKHSVAQVHANLVRLLGDKGTADLKIVTSDGKELFAHKVILQAQCPVFESMFRSDMSENKTGIVNVEDVTAKTMGIVLHLIYSGELLPSWKDLDTVVEFTYAAGKYQLTNVLELLDKVLGSRDEEDATHADVELLDLARKLDLKTAEKDLMDRIRKTMGKMESGGEFFALWGGGGRNDDKMLPSCLDGFNWCNFKKWFYFFVIN